ncbi:NADase-type glycan-binding domain-containing protein [Treponema saccharophilum]|uniref:NADase-type glycan-binding domain-containing protein n=1 Tax=Treponema saccharophilum TaxID=165 RepID=UPI001FE069D8|nr:hypothetical protein [Treponema saccharophilum]
MKREYNTKEELQQDIVNAVSEQYGMQFEITPALSGSNATMALGWDYGFYGYLRPADIPESYKNYNLYTDYTVCNETGTFKTQAHVRMFEKLLKADVDRIFADIGMKYDILEFRGMDRNINKWSKNSTYEEYKKTNDFETWIYIKLPKQEKIGIENNRIKTLSIKNGNNTISVDLKETLQPQVFDVDFSSRGFSIKSTNLYKGTKYNDTCIAEFDILTDDGWLIGD